MKPELRIVTDLLNFQKDKPDGIYLYINKENYFVNYALIIGPENTPYAFGFFLFEIKFPKNYPYSPPEVKMLTTNHRIRFNPNLYEDGKVCLSILGTWPGPKWEPIMNLKLVLLSIRSLMGETPINNEPGYDRIKPTSKQSINYNNFIIYNKYKIAIIDMVRSKFSKYSKYFKKEIKNELIKNYKKLRNNLLSYKVTIGNIKIDHDIYFLPGKFRLDFDELINNFEKYVSEKSYIKKMKYVNI